MHQQRTILIKPTDASRKRAYHDASETIRFSYDGSNYQVQFDPLNAPEWASSWLVECIFTANLTDYLTLEKTGPLLSSSGELFPCTKQAVVESSLDPLQKRHLLKMQAALHNLCLKEIPSCVQSCGDSFLLLTDLEERILAQRPSFSEILQIFRLEGIQQQVSAGFGIPLGADFSETLQCWARFAVSRSKFADCGPFLLHQYGAGDVLQAFERLVFVHGGFVLQEAGALDGNVFRAENMTIKFEKAIEIEVPPTRQKFCLQVLRETPALIEKFGLQKFRNTVVSGETAVTVRRGQGQHLSRGFVSLESSGSGVEILGLPDAVVVQRDFWFDFVPRKSDFAGGKIAVAAGGCGFEGALRAADCALVETGAEKCKLMPENATLAEMERAVDELFSGRAAQVEE